MAAGRARHYSAGKFSSKRMAQWPSRRSAYSNNNNVVHDASKLVTIKLFKIALQRFALHENERYTNAAVCADTPIGVRIIIGIYENVNIVVGISY